MDDSESMIPASDAQLTTENIRQYLQSNLTADFVLQVLEECLLEENSTYNSISFEQALKELQQKDSGRYHMLKALMEGFATKEGMVMLDPKLVTASYKQRLKQLELLKTMGWFRRLCYRMGLALKVLVGQTTKTGAIQEAIQVTGEVQIAQSELAVLELRKAQTVRETNDLTVRTSEERRKVLQETDREAAEKTESIYRQSRDDMAKERQQAREILSALYKETEQVRSDLAKTRAGDAYSRLEGYRAHVGLPDPPSPSIPSSHYSRSRSFSASDSESWPSASASASASPEWDED